MSYNYIDHHRTGEVFFSAPTLQVRFLYNILIYNNLMQHGIPAYLNVNAPWLPTSDEPHHSFVLKKQMKIELQVEIPYILP